MVTMRQLDGEKNNGVKIIWWYIAALDEGVGVGSAAEGEEEFTPKFFPLEQAVQMLSFQTDRDVLEKAISLVV